MKKKIGLSVLVSALLAVTLLGVAFAGNLGVLPGSGWWTAYQVQNIGTVTGTLTMVAYDSASANTFSSPGFLYGPGSALIYNPGQTPNYPVGQRIGFGDGTQHLPSGFLGSAVLSSDQPMVAVVNLGNNPNGSVGVAGGQAAAYYDASPAAIQLSFPIVKHNFFNQTTTFFVQAAGASSVVTVTYRMNDGSIHQQVTTIGANQMFVFDPAAATPPVASSGCGGSSTTSPCFGGAVAVGSTPIVGSYVEAPHTGSPATFALSTAAFVQAQQDFVIAAPTMKNAFFGGTTGWTIQNTSGTTATVQMTFTVSNIQGSPGVVIGQQLFQTIQIGPNQSKVVNATQGNIGGIPPGVFFAAVASSNNKLVGVVNESNTNTGKAVYSSFARSLATNKVAFPLIKEFFFGQTTGTTIQNADVVTATVTMQYINGTGIFTQNTHDIGPGAAFTWRDLNNPANASKYPGGKPAIGTNNSVIVTSTGGKIIGLAQEAATTTTWSSGGVDLKNYEGFSLP